MTPAPNPRRVLTLFEGGGSLKIGVPPKPPPEGFRRPRPAAAPDRCIRTMRRMCRTPGAPRAPLAPAPPSLATPPLGGKDVPGTVSKLLPCLRVFELRDPSE